MRHPQLFVNLPVRDLARSQAFYAALGYEFNPQFTNETAACMIISDHNFAMLLSEPFFKTFTPKPLVDAKAATEVLVAVACESREQVRELIAKARAAGGTIPRDEQDLGFMLSHAFEDPDGHIWEPFFMDMSQMPQMPAQG